MNMTDITANTLLPQSLSRPVAPSIEKSEPGLQQSIEDPREARAKAFYTREAEPWNKKAWLRNLPEGGSEMVSMTKEMWLDHMKSFSNLELRVQQSIYSKIRNELGVFKPELANKNFSYTLGDDAQIKVLDPDQSLSGHELEYLTTLFNGRRGFKDSVIEHAKMAMALVDHDDEVFGGKYTLNLLNIQHTLDYGKLVILKPEDMYAAFVNQILDNGEKREKPLVDTTA